MRSDNPVLRLPSFVAYFRKLCAILTTTLIIAGCSQSELEYRANGIGADLYSTGLKQATKNLNDYFDYICVQAGYTELNNSTPSSCRYGTWNTENWAIFVHTGFNDIDRRCDDYLAWLEQVRNREAFGNSQLNAIEVLVDAVKVAAGTASTSSLAIVGAAFGYSSSLFSDYHRFFYNGLESSTIKSIVSLRRLGFRRDIRDNEIKYKPDAVYILRSYLRICMPFTITMDANTFARSQAADTGIPEYTDTGFLKDGLLSKEEEKQVIKPEEDFGSRGERDDFRQDEDLNQVFKEANSYTRNDLRTIQKKFCLQPHGLGVVGKRTLAAIKLFEQTRYQSLDNNKPGIDGKIDNSELTFLEDEPDCVPPTHKNYSEIKDLISNADKLKGVIGSINSRVATGTIPEGSTSDTEAFRNGVTEARKKFKDKLAARGESVEGPSGFLKDQVTPALIEALTTR